MLLPARGPSGQGYHSGLAIVRPGAIAQGRRLCRFRARLHSSPPSEAGCGFRWCRHGEPSSSRLGRLWALLHPRPPKHISKPHARHLTKKRRGSSPPAAWPPTCDCTSSTKLGEPFAHEVQHRPPGQSAGAVAASLQRAKWASRARARPTCRLPRAAHELAHAHATRDPLPAGRPPASSLPPPAYLSLT